MKHWEIHRLGELVEILSGFAFDSENFTDSGDMPIVRIRDVVPGRSSTFYNGEYDKKYVLRDGDMLIGMDGEFNLARWQGGPALLNQRVCRIAASNGVLDEGYLFRFLPAALKAIEDVTPYVTVKHLSVKTIRDIEIPLPPLAEQRRIAELLDRAEVLRAKRRAALAQLDSLTQSLFLDLFGDPATNPKGWPRKPTGQIGRVITGNTPPRANPGNYGNAIDWIKSDNINTPHYYLTKAEEGLSELGKSVARIVPAGSILVTCIAGSPDCIGNAAMADREVAFNQQINAFVPECGDSHFYYAQILVGKRLIQEASTAGMKGMVSKGRFEQIRLLVPPIELQREFARQACAVEKLKTAQRASLAELDALFASLQHRAFRGEL